MAKLRSLRQICFGILPVTNEELIEKAISVLNPRPLSTPDIKAGMVACALLTKGGKVYTGVCVDAYCALGFCAETAAIGAMITAGETAIDKIVAVGTNKNILTPCGRCREFMYQIDNKNHNCIVLMPKGKTSLLKELLPQHWYEEYAKVNNV